MTINEFFSGLSGPDAIAVNRDILLYGNAFVEVNDGKKKRLSVDKWPAIIERHNARPLSDGTPGMRVQ